MIMQMENARGSEPYNLKENTESCTVAENGCKERKCPCRMWVNCRTYVDTQIQALRLENKEYDINRWYKNNFRNNIRMEDMIMNG